MLESEGVSRWVESRKTTNKFDDVMLRNLECNDTSRAVKKKKKLCSPAKSRPGILK